MRCSIRSVKEFEKQQNHFHFKGFYLFLFMAFFTFYFIKITFYHLDTHDHIRLPTSVLLSLSVLDMPDKQHFERKIMFIV